MPIVDLAVRLALPPGLHGRASRVIITQSGRCTVGLLVDAVTEVLLLGPAHIESAPTFLESVPHAACFQGVAKWEDRLLLLLDLARVLSADEGNALGLWPAEA